MTARLTMRNYKSIRHAHIDLRPGLNILIGPNGSGKTCLLSALKFLRDVFRFGAARAMARQGGARRVYHRGKSDISFSLSSTLSEKTYRRRQIPCNFKWEVTISQAGPEKIATIVSEKFEIAGEYKNEQVPLFSVRLSTENKPDTGLSFSPQEFGKDLFSSWKREYARKNKTDLYEDFKRKFDPILVMLGDNRDRSCFPILAPLDDVLFDIYANFILFNEYNIVPDIARMASEVLPFAQMASNGESVSEVIDALENKRYHKLEPMNYSEFDDQYEYGVFQNRNFFYPIWRFPYRITRREKGEARYVDALVNINTELAAAVKPISRVSVGIDNTTGRRFVQFISDDEYKFYPEEVSDGTVKWLCILVSLFVPFSKSYLLEEPENFLHPWMQQRLISIMREQAKREGTIFLLSSHSSTILNSAYPEEILVVKHADDGTQISEISDIDAIRGVLEESSFHLGDLWVSGAIGGTPSDE